LYHGNKHCTFALYVTALLLTECTSAFVSSCLGARKLNFWHWGLC